jgi:hypothetical protein
VKLLRTFFEFVLASLILSCATNTIMAQAKTPTPQSPDTSAQKPATASATPAPAATPPILSPPAASPADVASVDSIIAAVYDVISGPAGKKRDWDRMKSLFIPGARLIPTGARQTGGYGSRVLTVDEYMERAGGFFEKEGFYEREAARKTEEFGQIVHVFSTYESRHAPGDAKPFQRGINSIQLMNDGSRWWVVTIFWQGEDEKHPLPEKYLKN